jgi:hypothetical protein
MFFCVGMMIMMTLAGCRSAPIPGPDVELPSTRTLSVSEPDKDGQLVTVKLIPGDDKGNVSPGVFSTWNKKATVTETADRFIIETSGMTINISAPPKGTPIFIQPLTRVLWDDAEAGGWDIKNMQLYISGTVVLEYEEHLTDLESRDKSTPVRENPQGTELSGQVTTGEIVTKSAYENILYVLETMTPGMALRVSTENEKNILEVSFETGANGEQQFLRFVQDPKDSYGYFYLEPANKSKITYGAKEYEVRFDERNGRPPYLMIRTELATSRVGKSLSGRRVQ